ncbi:hypothetical protein B1H19_02365 [Streptomyces gilvosporeus]|uniref:Uncharacterized protein n=2 Tax=Streptomyces gilvosporeus TaxID=553510 RepID=A0A1V0TJR5_9ACTN|nr:hypothetical protein B1H19_02365 [Streptomyces gilvosporeus]
MHLADADADGDSSMGRCRDPRRSSVGQWPALGTMKAQPTLPSLRLEPGQRVVPHGIDRGLEVDEAKAR